MSEFNSKSDNNGILRIDASNAFNVVRRPLALWNARILWPPCAHVLFNT